MKKFTMMMIALLSVVVAFAAGPKKQFTELQKPVKASMQLGQQINAKKAPAALTKSMLKAKARGMKKAAAAEPADPTGYYIWDFLQSNSLAVDISTATTSAGSEHVTISQTEEGGYVVSGMFGNDLTATTVLEDGATFLIIDPDQTAGTSSYGDYRVDGCFYYEGDDEYDPGWYLDDIYGLVNDDGSITFPDDIWFAMTLITGDYVGYQLQPYWLPGSTLTLELPKGVAVEDYVVFAQDYNEADFTAPVNVAVDGNDVYIRGLSELCPKSWVKGSKDGNTVTFPAMQYVGDYGTYGSCYAFYGEDDVVFVYDETADTYTAEGEVYGLLDYGEGYYDGYYFNPVLKKVVEMAGMPVAPAITELKNGNYGWYINFNVPLADVDGNPLAKEKLSYEIFTDIEGEIAPMTFTPATHVYLTEDMTIIPYGFTENYDFYTSQIFLNDLYDKNWNNIGIKSIYTGGGETNETEIQWFFIQDYKGENVTEWVAADQGYGNAQAISEFEIDEYTTGTLDIGTNTKDSPKYYSSGKSLRMYVGNTLTINSTKEIVKIEFTMTDTEKHMLLSTELGNYEFDAETKVGTWTGEASKIVFNVPDLPDPTTGEQARIQQITVYYAEEVLDPEGMTFTFDESDMEGWTTIDADGDGYDWMLASSLTSDITPRGGQGDALLSMSYKSSVGALTPDNYLVSPKVKLGSTFSFFAVAQDASYPAEHFGVFVSTTGNDPEDFVEVDEWTLTKVRAHKVGPRKVQGNWYQYIVDMSAYDGEKGYVAIRHYDCTDQFYMLVDDITFGTPEEYEQPTTPDLVELPEGVETEEWTLCAVGEYGDVDVPVKVGIDGTDMYIQGLGLDDLPDAWVKGTIDGSTVTFAKGQYMGEYEGWWSTYSVYLCGYDEEEGELSDVVFTYDAENGRLSTDYVFLNTELEDINYLDYYWYVDILKEFNFEKVAPEIPENVEMVDYQLTATHDVEQYDEEAEDYVWVEEETSYFVKVGFDGNDVYFTGLYSSFPEGVAKGTLNADGTISIPANQFMGTYYGIFTSSDIYVTSVDYETLEMADLVLNYDAETGRLTTEVMIINNSHKDILYEDWLNGVVMTLIPEVAGVPADPSIDDYDFYENRGWGFVDFTIDTNTTGGNLMAPSKLAYQFYVGSEDQPLTLTSDLYEEIAEDMTVIPYEFTDDYDISNSRVYLNQPAEEQQTWGRIGLQTIYYGGGEENRSNIVWYDLSSVWPVETAISEISTNNGAAVVYDLQGRRVAEPGKGLYIVNGKVVVRK